MQAIEAAREKRVQDDLDAFLAKRFGTRMVEPIKAIHQVEEERPIETLWDVTVAATAHARSIPNNDKRLEIERAAGELLKLAACPRPLSTACRQGLCGEQRARLSGNPYRELLWEIP